MFKKELESFTIETLADMVAREIKHSGLSKWDIYLYDEQVNSVNFCRTVPNYEAESHNLSYFIRAFHEKDTNMGVGVVHLNSTELSEIQKAISRAITISKSNQGPVYELVPPVKCYPSPEVIDNDVWVDPKGFLNTKRTELSQNLREIMRAQTTFGKFRVYKTQKMLVNSVGFNKIKQSTHFYYEFGFRAESEQKMKVAEYWISGNVKTPQQLHFENLIPEWTTMARDALRAKSPPQAAKMDVLFTPRLVRIGILETLGYSITGSSQFTNTSRFQIGDRAGVEELSIIDDGTVEGGLRSSAWDSEGTPKQRTTVIDHGTINAFLYDQKFATMLGTQSTGNAQRYPHKGGHMELEFNNLLILPGSQALKDIVAESKRMIYVNKFSWLRPNPLTGDFGATILNGYLIENGQFTQPLKGGTISGNMYDLLNNIESISKETRIVENADVPFIKFKDLRISSA